MAHVTEVIVANALVVDIQKGLNIMMMDMMIWIAGMAARKALLRVNKAVVSLKFSCVFCPLNTCALLYVYGKYNTWGGILCTQLCFVVCLPLT